ncbi:serpin family protein [uncultured Ruminococcus sp.]|uniref:serpin family protein n=1 Tax=uncultured Ruminococcus sp. TaxID=165186 RepID=UPI0025E42297|nr:serpin family protein [uncultured Ruminococcus sp.]
MGDKTKIKRIAACIMSTALVFGFAGSIKPPAAPVIAAETENENEYIKVSYNAETNMYEYEFIDAYIYDIDADPRFVRITLIPSMGRNTYFYEYAKEIELRDSRSTGIYPDDYTSSYELVKDLAREQRVNIKFASVQENDELAKTGYWNGRGSGGIILVDEIVSVKDPNEHYYGDINDDGVVDAFDVLTYKKYIAGTLSAKLTEDQFLNGDINFDTNIDDEDLRQVVDYTLGRAKTFNGASAIGSVRLDNTVNVQSSEGTATDEKFAGAEMNFGVDLLKKCYENKKEGVKNLLISPLSVSAALSMTANGADGETLGEMEKVLGNGLSLDEMNEYMAYYISQLPDEEKEKIYLADSIWFKDDPTLKVYDEFLETNKKYYNAEIYKSAFEPDTIVKDVNSWVNRNTQGMIPTLITKENIKSNTMMMLINTLYFEAEWWSPYLSTTDGTFTDLDGNKLPIKKMDSMERQYFDLGNADAFKKPYKNGDYSFVGILPHEDVDFNEYISNLDGAALAEGLKECEDPDTVDLYVMIPKFKYNYSESLKDILSDLGMKTAFDENKADFSKINDLSVEDALPLYIDDVLHKTKIEVTEKGTKAAAATAVVMGAGAAAPIEKKKVYIYLDRPFVYMIVDKNNVPLFIGAATQLETK